MNEKEEVLNRMTNRLNLYRISQSVNEGYDTYSDAIVAAHDEEEARHINPRGGHINPRGGDEAQNTELAYEERLSPLTATQEVLLRLLNI